MFSIQELQKSVTCITFGQPFINAPFVEEAIQKYVTMKYTFHAVYDDSDLFPIVLHYAYQRRSGTLAPISQVTQLTSSESEDVSLIIYMFIKFILLYDIQKFQDEHVGNLLHRMDSLQDVSLFIFCWK